MRPDPTINRSCTMSAAAVLALLALAASLPALPVEAVRAESRAPLGEPQAIRAVAAAVAAVARELIAVDHLVAPPAIVLSSIALKVDGPAVHLSVGDESLRLPGAGSLLERHLDLPPPLA
jgi:hypothetical protein